MKSTTMRAACPTDAVFALLFCSILILLMSLPLPTSAQDESADNASWDSDPALVSLAGQIEARRLTSGVQLDGILDEHDWKAPGETRLIQNSPCNGANPRHRTEFWVAYDDQALYVAARMFDSAPDSIEARLGRRDSRPSSD